jgi:hypothetical protein
MRILPFLFLAAVSADVQPPGKWPPDSVVNTQVIPPIDPPRQARVSLTWGR